MFDDLVRLEGSAMGRQYICTTSDLALLAGTFANSTKSQNVNLGSIPPIVRNRLLNWIERGAVGRLQRSGRLGRAPHQG